MDSEAEASIETIFKLLVEQRENLKHWPYTSEQIARDRRIWAQLRELCDRISQPVPPAQKGKATKEVLLGESSCKQAPIIAARVMTCGN